MKMTDITAGPSLFGTADQLLVSSYADIVLIVLTVSTGCQTIPSYSHLRRAEVASPS